MCQRVVNLEPAHAEPSYHAHTGSIVVLILIRDTGISVLIFSVVFRNSVSPSVIVIK